MPRSACCFFALDVHITREICHPPGQFALCLGPCREARSPAFRASCADSMDAAQPAFFGNHTPDNVDHAALALGWQQAAAATRDLRRAGIHTDGPAFSPKLAMFSQSFDHAGCSAANLLRAHSVLVFRSSGQKALFRDSRHLSNLKWPTLPTVLSRIQVWLLCSERLATYPLFRHFVRAAFEKHLRW